MKSGRGFPARGQPISAACAPPFDDAERARAILEAVERTGRPCFRCLANDGTTERPRCRFLARGFTVRRQLYQGPPAWLGPPTRERRPNR